MFFFNKNFFNLKACIYKICPEYVEIPANKLAKPAKPIRPAKTTKPAKLAKPLKPKQNTTRKGQQKKPNN